MPSVKGTTRLAGVVGWPLDHSLSPAMHNAAYQELGLNWVYVPLAVPDEQGLRRLVAAVRSLPFVGFNITMPYKATILELCDEVATAASMAGAVNTVHVAADGRLIGYNTDGRGILESLSQDAGFDPAGKKVALVGAGGAAAAAFVALILAKSASITVVNRNLEHAEELLDRMAARAAGIELDAATLQGGEVAVVEADLVVNATPAGMRLGDESPVPVEWLREGQVVLDMVYGTPAPTHLVAGARSAGAVAIDGLGMLVAQGATAVDIWNPDAERHAPRDIMRQAAERQLAEDVSTGTDA
jgi:shikimate dehydrogenase